MKLSPTGIKRFENCPASFIYYKILPRIDNPDVSKLSLLGTLFHNWAEDNFEEDLVEQLSGTDELDKEKDLEGLELLVQDRDYFKLPSTNELKVEGIINKDDIIWGYADRVAVDLTNRKIIVIDYKTTMMPDPYNDKKQLLSYVHCIYSNHETRKALLTKIEESYPEEIEQIAVFFEDLKPTDFIVIIDYVQANRISQFDVSETVYRTHIIYLTNTFNRINKLMKDFLEHKDINKVTHIDGNCKFCSMNGFCKVYQIVINSYYDVKFDERVKEEWDIISLLEVDDNDNIINTYYSYPAGTPINEIKDNFCLEYGIERKEMEKGNILKSSSGLIAEYLERERIIKINEARLSSLKRTFMERYENDELLQNHFNKMRTESKRYPTEEFIREIMPKLVKDAIKDIRFKDIIDKNKITNELVSSITPMFGTTLKKSNIPDKYKNIAAKHEFVQKARPYLRRR